MGLPTKVQSCNLGWFVDRLRSRKLLQYVGSAKFAALLNVQGRHKGNVSVDQFRSLWPWWQCKWWRFLPGQCKNVWSWQPSKLLKGEDWKTHYEKHVSFLALCFLRSSVYLLTWSSLAICANYRSLGKLRKVWVSCSARPPATQNIRLNIMSPGWQAFQSVSVQPLFQCCRCPTSLLRPAEREVLGKYGYYQLLPPWPKPTNSLD